MGWRLDGVLTLVTGSIDMAFKDILVHAGGATFDERARLAVRLANAHGAHVVGLHVTQPPDIPPYVEAQLTLEVLQAQERYARIDREKSQAAFEAATQGILTSAEWRAVDGDAVEVLHQHGRHADLLVLGQTDPDAAALTDFDIAGRTVLGLGRPVLVAPYVGTFKSIGERVLVAWDGSRTAARALADAIPMLQKATAVQVLSLNPSEAHADMAGVDIATHLARHGIKVEVRHGRADEVGVGAMLLSRAADFGADMIVMGAYGHARWRQLVLGGVTEHMLEHMTVPVLMSH
jgi:nucleotide-binding universal stress UspA family protein